MNEQMVSKTKIVKLNDEQISAILFCLSEKKEDLKVISDNFDGLEPDTIRNIMMQIRDIDDAIRQIQFYEIIES